MNDQSMIKTTATIKGQVFTASDTLISYGVTCDASLNPISVASGSMVLENSLLESTKGHSIEIGQKTVIGHRCHIRGAKIGDLCEIGNGAQIGEGAYIGDFSILGEGCVLPPGAKLPSNSVALGNPYRIIRGVTEEDREMIKALREGDLSLNHLPLKQLEPQEAAEDVEATIAYGKFVPELKTNQLGKRAEIVGDVVIGEDTVIGNDVKIIGDWHGSVRIGNNVEIGDSCVLHLLPEKELTIKDKVKIGPNCIIHGCILEESVIVEENAIVSDDAHIGKGSRVKAHSLVPQRRLVPEGVVAEGFPVKEYK